MDNMHFTFLYVDLYSMGKTWVYPENVIPYNILRYIVKGKAEFCIDWEEIVVEENQIVYIPSGCRMSCNALTDTFESQEGTFPDACIATNFSLNENGDIM